MHQQRARRGTVLGMAAPEGATMLRLASSANIKEYPVATDVALVDTSDLPAAEYKVEWETQGEHGTELVDGGYVEVMPSLKEDGVRAVAQTWEAQVLAAAEKALATAAQGTQINFSVAGTSFTYETREDLLRFVRRLRNSVYRQRGLRPMSMKVTL